MTVRPVVCFSGRISKQGNRPEECEDEIEINLETGHVAIADGATEASYAQQWAQILVRAFPHIAGVHLDLGSFETWLGTCQRDWSAWKESLEIKCLPWFTQEKLSLGSFATLLGISFDLSTASEDSLIWQAVAYGDSCLFIVKDDNFLRESFPLQESASFNLTPPLLNTATPPLDDRLRILTGSVSPSDKMYLATDALAQWFIESYREFCKPWAALDAVGSEEDLLAFVGDLREGHRIRNDDVALVRINFEPR